MLILGNANVYLLLNNSSEFQLAVKARVYESVAETFVAKS